MLVYSCNGLTNDDLGPGGDCNTQSQRIGICRAYGVFVAGWAVGGIVSDQV